MRGVAYVLLGEKFGDYDIHRVDVATLSTKRLVTKSLVSSIAGSSSQVVVSAARGEGGHTTGADRLYLLSSSGLKPVAPEGLWGSSPAISDTGLVAFAPQGDGGVQAHRIDAYDLTSGEQRTLVSEPEVEWKGKRFLETGSVLIVARANGAGGELVRIDAEGNTNVIFRSRWPIGMTTTATDKIAVALRTPGNVVPRIDILSADGRREGSITGWRLLDWAPDDAGLLLFREPSTLAYAPLGSLVPRVLGTLPAPLHGATWLARDV